MFEIQSVDFEGDNMSVVYNIKGDKDKKTHVVRPQGSGTTGNLRPPLDKELTDAVIEKITGIVKSK